jgi:hypothetical protein
MGQFVLGLRSLAVKLAVFFVLAALLAWILGGTLWPRPHLVRLTSNHAQFNGDGLCFWQISIEERKQEHARWELMHWVSGAPPAKPVDGRSWHSGAGPISSGGVLYYGGCDAEGKWVIVQIDETKTSIDHPMPDRLAVEQQLARVQAGLPVQQESTILQQRAIVIDPNQSQPMNAGSATP